jgi:thioredoxin-related protein
MNKKTLITIFIGIFITLFLVKALITVQPPEIANAPEWKPIEKVNELAAAEDKLIFIDVFEVGCKYCRAMEREVYPDSTVKIVLEGGYIPAKINGNGEEQIEFLGSATTGAELAQKYGIYAFPSVMILDAEGNLIKKNTGYMGVDDLRRFLYLKEENKSS